MGLFTSVAARLRPSSEPVGPPELTRLARGGGAGLLAAARVVLGRQVGLLGRATVCLAVAVGALVFWVAVAPAPAARLRLLLPRVHAVDLLPFAAAGVMAGLAARWALRGAGESALVVLTRGWDHSAHFYMTTMIRRSGAVMDRPGGGPGGDEWAYRKYPQGFHTVAATIMEVLGGSAVVDAQRELTLYVQALAVVAVVCVLLVVAAVTALPRLWSRPWIALPLTVFVAAILVLGPGGSAVVDGFPNFVLAFSLLAVVPTLTVLQGRVHSPVTLLALGGAVVGIAHGWILLLALASPAVVAVGYITAGTPD